VDWYTKEERDRLLEGMFRLEPQWYLFYYLTTRLGLRTGEVYAIAHRQFRREPPRLVVDQAVQRGTKTREALLAPRKNDEAYELDLTADVLAAVDWHIGAGYAGSEFLFSKTGAFPRYIDSHVRPLKLVQRKLGLRMLSHPQGEAAFGGQPGGDRRRIGEGRAGSARASLRAEHAQVRAPRLRRPTAPWRALMPTKAPHDGEPREAHVNLASTAAGEPQNSAPSAASP
jgi:hypothetical protein